MSKQTFVLPISKGSQKRSYPASSTLSNKDQLQTALKKIGVDAMLEGTLKGGFISQIYEARINNKLVVVKHTENVTPFDPTELFINRKGHNIDTKVLKLLSKSKTIRVPHVYYFFPKITTTIMEDLLPEGFQLLSSLLVKKELPANSASSIGTMLANLARESKNWKQFSTNESAQESIYERGLELRLAYPNSQSQYLSLEKQFTENATNWVWPDGHPKNMFVKPNGEVAFIDFGRSHWGDQQYMLPNFLAHIVIYSIAGYLNKEQTKTYIINCVSAYKKLEPVNEKLFCEYLAMEVLHRGNGKWIEGINKRKQKIKLLNFGLTIFDDNIYSIEKLLQLL